MLFTIGFALILFFSLWPYFIVIGILDYKKNPEAREGALPDRPARRTIGRINSDVVKSISGIATTHVILCLAFYGLPEIRNFMSDNMLIVLVTIGSALAFFIATVSNRRAHAYATLGQIIVIHICASLSIFTALSFALHYNTINFKTALILIALVLGVMMIFSRNQYQRKNYGA